MVVISGLDYKNYLEGHDRLFNTARNFAGEQKLRRGDFDLLIIHKKYGLFIIEVKAVGHHDIEGRSGSVEKDQEALLRDKIIERIEKAVDQLQKVKFYFSCAS